MPPTVKVMRRPEAGSTSYLRATLKGMALTFKHLVNPNKVTLQYPEEQPDLSPRWRDHIDMYGTRGSPGGYYPRFMDHREDARPPSGRRSGSEVAFSRSDFLDPFNVAHATLIPLTPAGRQQNADLDAALSTAVNDWQVAEWLDPEPRLRASMVIPFEDPPAAVAEYPCTWIRFSGKKNSTPISAA